jgi:hypothetical protein
MAFLDRVVAVHASFADSAGTAPKMGTGYLLDDRTVLTATHVMQTAGPGRQWAKSIRITRAFDFEPIDVRLQGNQVVSIGGTADWAIVHLPGMVKAPLESPKPRFMRVDQRSSGALEDCIVIGFPQFASDLRNGPAHREVHGKIALTDGVDSHYLLMRCDLAPATVAGAESAWAGLSGGLVFHKDRAIGVVRAHSVRDIRAAHTGGSS